MGKLKVCLASCHVILLNFRSFMSRGMTGPPPPGLTQYASRARPATLKYARWLGRIQATRCWVSLGSASTTLRRLRTPTRYCFSILTVEMRTCHDVT